MVHIHVHKTKHLAYHFVGLICQVWFSASSPVGCSRRREKEQYGYFVELLEAPMSLIRGESDSSWWSGEVAEMASAGIGLVV